ncbi:dihydroorotate dehydrogenase electron transfer subunit [Terrilactibacillus sp. S3-3]|nr:dihydroorotate dehydrogenase electron transfer subunit [Terrilactibacillus sp. S3-3]
MKSEMMSVVSQRQIADAIFELKVQGKLAAAVCQPGQFVHLRVERTPGPAPLLRRPISICSVDTAKSELTMLYRAGGVGTKQLTSFQAGETIDVLGPLGNGFPVEAVPVGGRAVLIGGGIGVPPLYGLSRALLKKGVQVIHILGFRSKKDVFYRENFETLGRAIVMTEDGSAGEAGLVTDALRKMNNYDVAYACGPMPMLKAVASETAAAGKPLYLSLEQRMGCGIGACLACVCHTVDKNDEKGYRRVCADGPVFKAGEVELC